MRNNILITGGAGFIGSHLADKLLLMGNNVTVVDDLSCGKKNNVATKIKFYKIKIQSPKIEQIFQKNKFNIVYHLAAQKNVRISVADPKKDANDNIIGSINLFENCRKYKIKKIIFASSGGAIYGETNQRPTKEMHPEWPLSPYGVAKLSVEKYLNYYEKVHGIPFVSLRYANVYGPRQDPKGEAGVIAVFVSRLLLSLPVIINGPGLQTRDFVYVKDVVQANILALNSKAKGIYNVGTSKEININDLFLRIKKIINSRNTAKHGPALAGEQQTSCLAIQKIKKELDFEVKYNLNNGLHETIEWFKNNII